MLDEFYGHDVGIPAYLLSGLIGLQRMDVGKHDSGEVVFGWVLGWTIGHTLAQHEAPRILGLDLRVVPDLEHGAPALSLSRSL